MSIVYKVKPGSYVELNGTQVEWLDPKTGNRYAKQSPQQLSLITRVCALVFCLIIACFSLIDRSHNQLLLGRKYCFQAFWLGQLHSLKEISPSLSLPNPIS